MQQHVQIFNELLQASQMTGRQIAQAVGFSESKISKFRSGKLDLEAGEFFRLLECLPKDYQNCFWARVSSGRIGIRPMILSATPDELQEILLLAAERYRNLRDNSRTATEEYLLEASVL